MWLVALGLFFENFDIGLLGAALPQISDSLGVGESESGYLTGWIRLGGLGTLLMLPLADRFGRRRLFLVALLGMGVGTFATAFSQSAAAFAVLQMITRVFMLAASMLGVVIVVEEFPAAQRGAGIGMLTVLGGLGYGLAAVLYAFVDVLPYGWRALYVLGVAPVFVVPFYRRSLQETRRFERRGAIERRSRQGLREWAEPILALARAHPRRVAAVGITGFFTAAGGIPLFQYASWHVLNNHGWTPGDYAMLVIGAGVIGVLGNVVGGRGSDRFGRRGVGSLFYAVAPLFTGLYFLGPAALLPLAWGLAVFCNSGGEVILRAMASELFPTRQRAASAGWLIGVQTLGWASGLFLVGWGTEQTGSLPLAVAAVAGSLVLGALALLVLPETSGHELESLHREDAV
jgi:putative MFS transporter